MNDSRKPSEDEQVKLTSALKSEVNKEQRFTWLVIIGAILMMILLIVAISTSPSTSDDMIDALLYFSPLFALYTLTIVGVMQRNKKNIDVMEYIDKNEYSVVEADLRGLLDDNKQYRFIVRDNRLKVISSLALDNKMYRYIRDGRVKFGKFIQLSNGMVMLAIDVSGDYAIFSPELIYVDIRAI